MHYFSPSAMGFFHSAIHGDRMPADAVPVTNKAYQALLAGQTAGKVIQPDANGHPVLVERPEPATTSDDLCQRIDDAADAARAKVAGDPLRAVEYDRARLEAEAFAAAGYQGEVPRMVAAWAINGRTPRQAADSILAEAAAYTEALYLIRETRLQAKEQIRVAIDAGDIEQAQDIAAETIAAIEAAVAGIGNNTGT
ncbi:hypothetical protein [Pseudomonas subflava]|uniref:hypothetical protein n=1 Tax=Pseudomonas subflava TaxID=2952933 RepID=UPI00207A2F6E|nr:hypothetical protein [Pseudomonas subflava]